jgi:hypothetical protein
VSNEISELFDDWANQIEANEDYVDALVANALASLLAAKVTNAGLTEQVTAKTTERDTVAAQRAAAEATLAALVGPTYTITVTTTIDSTEVTGDFSGGLATAIDGGFIETATSTRPGTLVTDATATTLTMSLPAKVTGTSTATIRTGSVAIQDAEVARLYAQAVALQLELDEIGDGQAVLDAIDDGRAALVAAGHHLAPATILTSAPGAALTANQTAALNTWIDSIDDGVSGTENVLHLWRGVVYRSDGTVTITKDWSRLDFHGSPLTAGATGGANRVHLTLSDCNNYTLLRPMIRGSLPAGAPAYSATYTGQHGIQVLGGTNIEIDRADVSDVLTSGIRCASLSGVKPNGVVVKGASTVTRCGNHVLAISACDDFEWKSTSMGSSGRETIAVAPAVGVVCNGVNLHNFGITGAVTDAAYVSITARSAGKVTTFKIDTITAASAHGPLTADIAATTSGQKGTGLDIIGNVGAGVLTNTDRAAWKVANYTGLRFSNNSQAYGRSGGSNVMYGLKGTNIDGTITVAGNTGTSALGEALIDGVTYPLAGMTISPTSLSAYTEDVDITNVVFTVTGAVGDVTWSWAAATSSSLPPGGVFTDTSNTGVLSTGAGGFTTPGTYNVEITAVDSSTPAQTKTIPVTVTVNANNVLAFTAPTSLPSSYTIGDAITPVQFTWQNAVGAVTLSKTGTLPAGLRWDTAETSTNRGKLRGTPVAPASSDEIVFKVTDSATPTPQEATFTATITTQAASSASEWRQTIGIVRNIASIAQMNTIKSKLATTGGGNGNGRMIRWGINMPTAYNAGTDTFSMTGTQQSEIAALDSGGWKVHLGANYCAPAFHRLINMGDGRAIGGTDYVQLDSTANIQGQWWGLPVTCGSAITHADGVFLKTATTGNKNTTPVWVLGKAQLVNSNNQQWTIPTGRGTVDAPVIIGGHGGTDAAQKMTPRCSATATGTTLEPYGRFVKKLVEQGGAHIRFLEMGNEYNHILGCQPFADPALVFRNFCHGYVAAKLANPNIIVLPCGPGDNNLSGAYMNPLAWYQALHAQGISQAGYFSALCSSNSVTPTNTVYPWDWLAVHAYGSNPANETAANITMNRLANIYNTFNGQFPLCPTEQGIDWNWDGTGESEAPPMNHTEAGNWVRAFFDYCHGNRRWGHVTQFTGTSGATLASTTATVEQRRAAADRIFKCPFLFAAKNPSGDNQKGLFGTNNVAKWGLGTATDIDPMTELQDTPAYAG